MGAANRPLIPDLRTNQHEMPVLELAIRSHFHECHQSQTGCRKASLAVFDNLSGDYQVRSTVQILHSPFLRDPKL